jgi:hypothetical protein
VPRIFAAGGLAIPIRLQSAWVVRDRPDSLHRFSAYRFHEDDLIPFQNGFRPVWRNGEELAGHRFGDPRPTTLTSYVWAYEW